MALQLARELHREGEEVAARWGANTRWVLGDEARLVQERLVVARREVEVVAREVQMVRGEVR